MGWCKDCESLFARLGIALFSDQDIVYVIQVSGGEKDMLRYQSKFFVVAIFLTSLLTGCASSQIKAVWKDPSYSARPQKVMVIAVLREPIYRRIIEDEFVLQFKLRGVDAIASYTMLNDRDQDDQAAIEKMVKQYGADSVLVTRMVSKRTVRVYYPATVVYRPPYYRKWPKYINEGYEMIGAPGYSTKYEYAIMETNLYDEKNDTLVWAATTETGVTNLNQTLIRPYIGNIMNMMSQYGLVRE